MKRKASQRHAGKAQVSALAVRTIGFWPKLRGYLGRPTNGASLAAFRIAVGLVMSLEALALCLPNPAAISAGTTPLETYYTGANITFHLPYPAFNWLPLLGPQWIHLLVGILAVAGLMMAIGLWYRLSAALVFLSWGYLWVVESTRTYWQSHYYLEVLLTFLLIWMPAARRFSLDAWLARHRNPPRIVPYWTILLLRGQLVIAYFYAGVAKLSTDWLLDAAPTRWVLADPAITRPYESWLTAGQLEFFQRILHSPGLAYFISWTGFLFDLSVGFLLLARRTRVFGLTLMVIFHATNHFIIFDDIGWFPLVGVATALIFLNPDWPERLWNWLRRPHWVKPEWAWFSTGAVMFPIVGATLGWKSAAPRPPGGSGERHLPGRTITAFVILWLAWQSVLPLRHYWIAGDGRFTYEGMSFSWRLKGEARHALGHQLYIQDSAIIAGTGLQSINWNEWHGDKVLHRRLDASRLNWSQLPEIIVLLEPLFGERIFYNPGSRPGPATETAIQDRIRQIWQELHGRPPDAVRPGLSLAESFDSLGTVLSAAGRDSGAAQVTALAGQLKQLDQGALPPDDAMKAVRAVRATIKELQTNPPSRQATYVLRGLAPFAMDGADPRAGSPFLIEDAALLNAGTNGFTHVVRNRWKNGPPMRNPRRTSDRSLGNEVLVVHVGDIGIAARDLLPQRCIFDSHDQPQQPAYIWWNSPKDLTFSKGLHVSVQAFFLRRYAQRVASLWETEYGRRPAVKAYTAVSLNGRPPQPLVDPEADLASVPVSWLSHNAWVRDLETPRIPREMLAEGRVPPGFSNRME